MTDVISVEVLAPDAAIREALDDGRGTTRALFLRRALLGGGSLALGGVLIGGLPELALGAPSAAQDVEILNFALLLEYLESEFYKEAVARGTLSGETATFARVVRDHEVAHVSFIQGALGSKARGKPTFDFRNTTSDPDLFRVTSRTLEDVGVAAYDGQGPRLTRKTLAAAAQIVSVEARHAAWIRRIIAGPRYPNRPGDLPAPAAFQPARSMRQVQNAVASTGFITSGA